MRPPIEGSFGGRLWLERTGGALLGQGRLKLLQLIEELGSITHAAKAMSMSYKAAWDEVARMNEAAGQPVVAKSRGGKGGGGETKLTDYGRELVQVFQVLQEEHSRFLEALSGRLRHLDSPGALFQRFTMRTSARNQFWGRISAIQKGAVNAEVALDLGGGEQIVASITNHSVESLDLREGQEACALIKASFVILMPFDEKARTSARNKLAGTITQCDLGAVNGEVQMELKGGRTLTATVTNESIRSLGLAVGTKALALVKASHVIIAVNG